MLLDDEREALIAEIESDPQRRELLRAIVLDQDRALAGDNVLPAAHRFIVSRGVLRSFGALISRLRNLGLERDMDTDEHHEQPQASDPLCAYFGLADDQRDTPAFEAAVIRELLARDDEQRHSIYGFVDTFTRLLRESFERHFPNRSADEFWSDQPATDDLMRARLAQLEAIGASQ